MLKSENARPSGWVYVDVRGRDLASVDNELRDAIGQQVKLEPGVSITYPAVRIHGAGQCTPEGCRCLPPR
ncbi:hypothetical protein ACPA9J_03880 [Pseudomonas aeruginosa]